MSQIGLNVVERAGSPVANIQPNDLTNVAVVVDTLLGPINEVFPITSVAQFQILFGGPSSSKLSFHEVKSLFRNAAPNPVNLYALRLATGGTAASFADGVSPDQITFTRAYRGTESPGAEGDNTKVEVIAQANGDFRLNVFLVDADLGDVLVETFNDLTTANIEGNVNTQSNYVRVDLSGTYELSALVKSALTSGSDPTYPTDLGGEDLSAFDNENVQLMFAPDYSEATSAAALEAYAAGRNDVLAISAPPLTTTDSTIDADYSTQLLQAKSFLSSVFNWVYIDDSMGGEGIWTPGIGAYIGSYYIRKLVANGSFAFIAPAGLDVSLRGIKKVNNAYGSGTINTLVRDSGVNVIQFYKGYGFVVRTSRTMSTLSKHYSIHIRRSLNYLISTFRKQFGVFEQKPNNVKTRRQLKSVLDNFLLEEYNNGMFETIGGFDSNVLVTCDESNNTPQDRQNRRLNASTEMNFAEIAETVTISVQQVSGQVSASES